MRRMEFNDWFLLVVDDNTRAQIRFRLLYCPPISPNGNLAQAAPGRNIPLCQNQPFWLRRVDLPAGAA